MRRSVPLLVLLLATTASCGQGERGGPPPQNAPARVQTQSVPQEVMVAPPAPEAASDTAQQQRAAAGPDIGPTAAPGVAFNYRYAFRLAAPRIAEVQEQHAAALRAADRRPLPDHRPALPGGQRPRHRGDAGAEARPGRRPPFRPRGVEAVTRAEGMLIESEISGLDAGSDIRRTGRSSPS